MAANAAKGQRDRRVGASSSCRDGGFSSVQEVVEDGVSERDEHDADADDAMAVRDARRRMRTADGNCVDMRVPIFTRTDLPSILAFG